MSEWKEYKFADLITDEGVSYGIVQPGFHKETNSVPIIRVNNIRNGKIETHELMRVDAEIESKYSRTRLAGGELLITVVGSVGVAAIAPKELAGHNVARAVSVSRIKSIFDPQFIRYSLLGEDIKHQLYSHTNDTVQPTLNLSSLKEIIFRIPPLTIQSGISQILSSLDDKIDLLHRQNKTLESLAETFFRQWFVEEAEQSWETKVLDDIISVKGGTTPSTTEATFWDGDIYWTSPRDLTNHNGVFLFDTQRKITEKGLAQIGSGLLPIGTLLLSSRAPIGYLAIIEIPAAINQGYIAIICNKSVSNFFMYLWCKQNMPDIENAGNGSVFQEISKSTFKGLSVTIPPDDRLKIFDTTITPYFEKIKSNSKQIRTLTQLRDTLLPKLLHGEVGVNTTTH